MGVAISYVVGVVKILIITNEYLYSQNRILFSLYALLSNKLYVNYGTVIWDYNSLWSCFRLNDLKVFDLISKKKMYYFLKLHMIQLMTQGEQVSNVICSNEYSINCI